VRFVPNGVEAIQAVDRYGGFARAAHLHKVQSADDCERNRVKNDDSCPSACCSANRRHNDDGHSRHPLRHQRMSPIAALGRLNSAGRASSHPCRVLLADLEWSPGLIALHGYAMHSAPVAVVIINCNVLKATVVPQQQIMRSPREATREIRGDSVLK
jgi:hypothetical protein